MNPVFVIADNIISPLGNTSLENFSQLLNGYSSVQKQEAGTKSIKDFYSSLFPETFWKQQNNNSTLTRFEQLLVLSIQDVLKQSDINPSDSKTGIIISSTKGNINLLEDHNPSNQLLQEVGLSSSAKKIAALFGFITQPIVVSQACISGLVALITAQRIIQAGLMNHIVVVGADLITKFILSGFQAFQAVSNEPCKPFDANRNGINLGEAAASIVLSANKGKCNNIITLKSGVISNDANHISGPSRTGKELSFAIDGAIQQAGLSVKDIDFISLHGTATLYNDDMESKALKLSQLQSVPANSLKGYFGHTLGAAGLIESVISIQSLKANLIIPTKGFTTLGTAENINVSNTLQYTPLTTCLKTASGFGGCNAAVVWKKDVHNV